MRLIDKDVIITEIEKLKGQLLRGACSSQISIQTRCKEESYDEVLALLDTIQEESVSEDLEKAAKDFSNNLDNICGSIGEQIRNAFKAGAEWGKNQAKAEIQAQSMALANGCPKEEPASKDFEDAANNALERMLDKYGLVGTGSCLEMFKLGAKWKKENLWKPADGDDLPEIDREVIVFVKYMEYPTYRFEFGHRPNPNGWDGKSLTTGEVEHYTPKTYDKCGWNIPNIKYWLDVELPKETEL